MLDAAAGLPSEVAAELSSLDHGEPRAMPPVFYTSPDVLAAEIGPVFLSGWICLGRADEIPNSGDFFIRDVLGKPLIVTRDIKNQICVLSNVCRHRGSRLVERSGLAKKFTCPYHASTCNLDGGLVRAPLMEADTASCNLPSFAVEEWMGWIFVNLDGTAAAGPGSRRMKRRSAGLLRPGSMPRTSRKSQPCSRE
ncbi:MAG: aromatic ring-hydroxylating dioxygenase subunit alpha [Paracoccaceae bacterium]